MTAGEQAQPVSWGLLRQEMISGHGKMQQLELGQPPPSLNNIPAEGGFGCRVRGEGWGWLGRERGPRVHSCAVAFLWGDTQGRRGEPWLRDRERCRIHPHPCSLSRVCWAVILKPFSAAQVMVPSRWNQPHLEAAPSQQSGCSACHTLIFQYPHWKSRSIPDISVPACPFSSLPSKQL